MGKPNNTSATSIRKRTIDVSLEEGTIKEQNISRERYIKTYIQTKVVA
jgi:hypothetical protein